MLVAAADAAANADVGGGDVARPQSSKFATPTRPLIQRSLLTRFARAPQRRRRQRCGGRRWTDGDERSFTPRNEAATSGRQPSGRHSQEPSNFTIEDARQIELFSGRRFVVVFVVVVVAFASRLSLSTASFWLLPVDLVAAVVMSTMVVQTATTHKGAQRRRRRADGGDSTTTCCEWPTRHDAKRCASDIVGASGLQIVAGCHSHRRRHDWPQVIRRRRPLGWPSTTTTIVTTIRVTQLKDDDEKDGEHRSSRVSRDVFWLVVAV